MRSPELFRLTRARACVDRSQGFLPKDPAALVSAPTYIPSKSSTVSRACPPGFRLFPFSSRLLLDDGSGSSSPSELPTISHENVGKATV